MKLLLVGLVTACLLSAQSDPTVTLARILSDKGTISAAELASVESADPASRLNMLVGVLKDKGLLDTGDLAKLSPPVQPTPAPPSQPTVSASVPVTTKKGVPVSLY
jgi:hypothetical protein